MDKPNLTPELTEHCKEAIKQYTEKLSMASQSYDKAILSLSTAALGYTFVFARYVISNSHHHSCLLSFTWFFLILSIVFVLVAYVFEQFHSEHRINYHYWCLTGKSEKPADKKRKHWSDDEYMILPILSGGCFLVGVILFALFVGNNI